MDTNTARVDLKASRSDVTKKWGPWRVLLGGFLWPKHHQRSSVELVDLTLLGAQANHLPFGFRGGSTKLNAFIK